MAPDFALLQEALDALSQGLGRDVDDVEFLLQTYRESFVDLLQQKDPSAESRAQVQGLRVVSGNDTIIISADDARQALLLSDELKLDEVVCVEYLIAAHEMRGAATADTAAGLFFEERQAVIRALLRLLSEDAHDLARLQAAPRHAYAPIVHNFVAGLLAESREGRPVLASRLVELLRDSSLEPSTASPLKDVYDEAGYAVPRSQLLATEKAMLAKCLLCAVFIDSRLDRASVGALLEHLATLSYKLRAGRLHADTLLKQQALHALLALVVVLTPQDARGAAAAAAAAAQDQARLQELFSDAGLRSRITAAGIPTDSYHAVLRLCWGVLCASQQPGGHEEVRRCCEDAAAAGALNFLAALLGGPQLEGEATELRELCAVVVYELLGQFLQVDQLLGGALERCLTERCMTHIRRVPGTTGGAYTLALASDDVGMGGGGGGMLAGDAAGAGPAAFDHLGSPLAVLAAVFSVSPTLWLDPAQRLGSVEPFITRVINSGPMRLSADVRVPFLDMMASLAAVEAGASQVISTLAAMAGKPALEMLSWRKLVAVVVEYCARYAGVMADIARQGSAFVPTRDERLMNEQEAAILVAFLGLVTAVLTHGAPVEVRAFVEGQERDAAPLLGGLPLFEPFLQLMCAPVPNTVKAALDDVLGGFARFRDYTLRMLDRLRQCVVVLDAAGAAGGSGLLRLDLVHQLNELEARREEYPETIAFVSLINRLLAPLQQGLPDGGLAFAHWTHFVMGHVLAPLAQRGYRVAAQKWQVAAAGFRHLTLMLEVLSYSGALPGPGMTSANQPPGVAVLADALSSGPVMQAVLHVLLPGYSDLSNHGGDMDMAAAKEDAVVAALQLLVAVLRLDEPFVAAANRLNVGDRYQPLAAQLRHRRLGPLLEYVCAAESVAVQVAAIQLCSLLAVRLPNVVELLQLPPSSDPQCALNLRRGFAVALRQSLLSPAAADELPGDLPGGAAAGAAEGASSPSSSSLVVGAAEGGDPRAALILGLLLAAADASASPNLAHLLMGYDPSISASGVPESVLMPVQEFSCLTVIIDALARRSRSLAATKPRLYMHCLHLLHRLAADPVAGPPMLQHLTPAAGGNDLVTVLHALVTEPLPPLEAAHDLVAALHQRAHLLRIEALLLLRIPDAAPARVLAQCLIDPTSAVSAAASDAEGLMAASTVTTTAGGAAAALLAPLQQVARLAPPEPHITDLPPEERRLQQEMSVGDVSVDMLLTNETVMRQAGVLVESDTGVAIFHFGVLKQLLKERYDDYVVRTRGGGAGVAAAGADAAREAVASAFRYAQQYNQYALVAGAQAALVGGWAQLVQVLFTRQYGLLGSLVDGSPADGLFQVLLLSLEVVHQLLGRQEGVMSATLCNVCRVLLSRLQEQALAYMALAQPADPLASVRVPSKCHELLRLLLELIQRSRRIQPVRVQLYGALLQFLHFSRGSKLSSCTPAVLDALLAGAESAVGNGNAAAVARLDSSQTELERGVAAFIQEHAHALVEAVSRDALDQSTAHLQQAVALHLLAAAMAADPLGATAAVVQQQSVPQAVLQLVVSLPPTLLGQPGGGGAGGRRAGGAGGRLRGGLYLLEALLALLLRLVEAGGGSAKQRQAAAQRLHALHTIQYLANCKALDFEPEDPTAGRGAAGPHSLRDRLHSLVTPVLRLLLAIVGSLPDSAAVKAEACQFVDAHHRMLQRVIREAGGAGGADWTPGVHELEQAELATSLLARLAGPGTWSQLHPAKAEALKHELYRLALNFCCLDAKSASPLVQALHVPGATVVVQPGTGSAVPKLLLALRVAELRCGLARFLRLYVSAAPTTDDLLRCVGSSGERSELDAERARPSLLLVRDMAEQAASDAVATLDELASLLQLLRTPHAYVDEAVITARLRDYAPAALAAAASAPPAALRAVAAHHLSAAASALDRRLAKLLYLLENSLAIVALHFLRCLPRLYPATGGSGAPSATATGRTQDAMLLDDAYTSLELMALPTPSEADAAKLGSASDLRFFMTRLQETCLKAEGLLSRSAAMPPQHSLEGLELMVRSLKPYIAQN